MKYTGLAPEGRARMMEALRGFPAFLASRFASLTEEQARHQVRPGDFSPVEHCWHLADLEAEGYAVRIGRLRDEVSPALADFDGGRIAEERDYRSKSIAGGLAAFAAARDANLAALDAVSADEWSRTGTQEGVGAVSLCDIPAMMAEHDRGHREEIEAWSRALGL